MRKAQRKLSSSALFFWLSSSFFVVARFSFACVCVHCSSFDDDLCVADAGELGLLTVGGSTGGCGAEICLSFWTFCKKLSATAQRWRVRRGIRDFTAIVLRPLHWESKSKRNRLQRVANEKREKIRKGDLAVLSYLPTSVLYAIMKFLGVCVCVCFVAATWRRTGLGSRVCVLLWLGLWAGHEHNFFPIHSRHTHRSRVEVYAHR